MITVKLFGGMGNQLWQRAYGLAVREVMDRDLQPVRDLYNSMNLSEFSPLDAWERMAEAPTSTDTSRVESIVYILYLLLLLLEMQNCTHYMCICFLSRTQEK